MKIKFLSRLDVSRILSDEIRSLRRNSSSSRSWSSEASLFFLIPLLISAFLVWQEVGVNQEFRGLLINSYAIFAGLLFGLQIFIFDIVSRVSDLKVTLQAARQKIEKIRDLSSNVSFEILVCLTGTAVLIISSLLPSSASLLYTLLTACSFYISIIFLFSLMSILKSVHILLLEEISYQEKQISEDSYY